MLSGFKTFIARGNVVDLAVGVVMGAAFGLVVSGLVESFINPLIAWLVGKPNFDSFLEFTVGSATVQPGAIITALVNFLIVAFALYLFVVMPMNALNARRKKEEAEEAPAVSEDVQLLSEIRDLLKAQSNN